MPRYRHSRRPGVRQHAHDGAIDARIPREQRKDVRGAGREQVDRRRRELDRARGAVAVGTVAPVMR
jgi:hypothetical protein